MDTMVVSVFVLVAAISISNVHCQDLAEGESEKPVPNLKNPLIIDSKIGNETSCLARDSYKKVINERLKQFNHRQEIRHKRALDLLKAPVTNETELDIGSDNSASPELTFRALLTNLTEAKGQLESCELEANKLQNQLGDLEGELTTVLSEVQDRTDVIEWITDKIEWKRPKPRLTDEEQQKVNIDLWKAARAGNVTAAADALKSGAEIEYDQRYWSKETPLILAAQYGHVQVVRLLLRKGADVNNGNYKNFGPMYYAAKNGQDRVVEILIDAGGEVDQVDGRDRWTPLMSAAHHGHASTVRILLRAGADINWEDRYGISVYRYAKRMRHQDVMDVLGN